jgi:hypothetical protein
MGKRTVYSSLNNIYPVNIWERRTGFGSLQGQNIFLFSTVPRPTLDPTQPPIQRVPAGLSTWVKRPKREADPSPSCGAKVKNVESHGTNSRCVPWHQEAHSLAFRDEFTFVASTSNSLYSLFWNKNESRLMRCHAICLYLSVSSSYQLFNGWTNLYETWYVCRGNWTRVKGILHKSLQSVCVSNMHVYHIIVAKQQLGKNTYILVR